jgi:CHAD domain-containing protein
MAIEKHYELSHSEPDAHGISRIAQRRIAKAIDSLQSTKLSDKRVHEARKQLKKARATLRLLRDSIADAAYRRENAVLRDAARPLSEVRDGKALLEALDGLVDTFGAPARALPVDGLKRALRRQRSEVRSRVLDGSGEVRSQRAELRKCRARMARISSDDRGWKVIGAGIERTYRRGYKALAAAQSNSSIERLHEWRKQAKYLRYQLQILRPLWPAIIGELSDQAHKLTNALGRNHDLAVLRDKVMESEDATFNGATRDALIALIDCRRVELRDTALLLGQRIYEEKPKVFAARFKKYWQDWISQPVSVR